ncbi:hypothetical protein [Marinobacter sp. X15-166B]|uniref:hypothetical protein n=1 Tax=Marinobacter sp. X15-166B TaxID=1897620 RepID=UPI00085BBDDA|nr:hypothetical protein [Marinobacter sp. X15-166B]OEY66812.1 hypothetical protein BG841_10335 [Marinobacter sp. X15-166B]
MAADQHPNPERYWTHRRRGYYYGMAWAFGQTPIWLLVAVLNPAALEALGPVIGWSYGISGTLIVSYYGGNMAQEVAKARWGRQ